jgi:IclR family transcriptional regulator, acetate operon repressor
MTTRSGDAAPAAGEGVRAVERALDVLAAFRAEDGPLPVAELMRRLALSRPTLYRLLGTLQQRGFLVAEGEPMRLSLGPAAAQLAHAWRGSLDLGRVAQPMMRALWEGSRETVALFVREDLHRICVAEMESPQPLRFRRGVGYRERLVRGASGRAILAFADFDEPFLRRLYAGTTVNRTDQADELVQIRKRGWALSRDELIEGAVALAAPVFDSGGVVAASLGVFGPSVRLKPVQVADVAARLCEQAARLSGALGHAAAPPPAAPARRR